MQDYIPLEVLETATKELASDVAKEKPPKGEPLQLVDVLYETLHLKDPHCAIPTFYKIVLRYSYGPVEKRSAWGVWTGKGQRLQMP
jgi:hypothetical protein